MSTISTSGISALQVIKSEHILRIINALSGVVSNDIIISSSLNNGYGTITSGSYSHAEGFETITYGSYSHAEGLNTIASGAYQHVQGQYNISSSAQSAFILGNGTSDGSRSNLIFASGSQVQVTGSLNISGSLRIKGIPSYIYMNDNTGGLWRVSITTSGTFQVDSVG